MHTKALFRTAQAMSQAGMAVLRFNFRGVGLSTGSFDGGIGERDDVRAVLAFAGERFPGVPLVLGGFSFGASVALGVGVSDPRVAGLLGLGLPLELYDFSYLEGVTKPVLLVQGENDHFGSGADVERLARSFDGAITVRRIAGAGHFFEGRFDALMTAVRDYFSTGPGASVLAPAPRRERTA